jgi:hypothetical protein
MSVRSVMRRLKASTTSGLLALFAIALQIALSFGHLHLEGVRRTDPGLAALRPGVQSAQLLPAQQPGDDDDQYCAICASIYLAANSFVPVAPELPVPLASQAVEHFDRTAAIFVLPRRALFQSRAPPLV